MWREEFFLLPLNKQFLSKGGTEIIQIYHVFRTMYLTGESNENTSCLTSCLLGFLQSGTFSCFWEINETSTRSLMHPICPQGRHCSKEFIVSQTPLSSTVADFWRMIWEHKTQTVVRLPDTHNQVQLRHTLLCIVTNMYYQAHFYRFCLFFRVQRETVVSTGPVKISQWALTVSQCHSLGRSTYFWLMMRDFWYRTLLCLYR